MHSEQPGFEIYDDAFRLVAGGVAELVKVIETDAHEGPVYVAGEDALYFTSIPRRSADRGGPIVAIKRIALDGYRFPVEPDRVEEVSEDANAANGMALDGGGHLVVCEQGGLSSDARISRLSLATGRTEAVVADWDGLRLNSPNDVVVRSDGSVWFTDPSYGYLQGFRPEPQTGDFVYRYDEGANRLRVVADSFDKPNGLAFSVDETVLYVGDSGANQEPESFYPNRPHHIVAFDVVGGRHLAAGRLFAVTNPGFPDGIKSDTEGRVYASSGRGVDVYESTGDLIGRILLPGAVNFAFGGPGNDVLFITTDTAVWAAVLNTKGA
jgi:gluconolactonase